MKIDIQDSFSEKLAEVVEFISKDKPKAARKFKADLLKKVKALPQYPLQFKRSIYFEKDTIRDMVFKGYTVVYKVDVDNKLILVFGLIKHQENLDQ